jgi:3-phenylpropionate/trans-cinnamate dioxygenase ferredoxin subunit
MARHRLCRVADITEGEMKSFDVDSRRVLVVSVGGKWYAVDDTCSHAEASLAMGELDTEDLTVTCPLHGAVFELQTGEGIEYPAVDPVDTFRVTIENGEVFVDVD